MLFVCYFDLTAEEISRGSATFKQLASMVLHMCRPFLFHPISSYESIRCLFEGRLDPSRFPKFCLRRFVVREEIIHPDSFLRSRAGESALVQAVGSRIGSLW